MKILLTSDTAGGVGTFAEELARGLARRGHAVQLAIFGAQSDRPPAHDRVERAWASFRLEWMDESGGPPAAEIAQARMWLARLARAFRPDLLHSNQFAFVDAIPGIPTLLGVHSDVISWWRTVHGTAPPDSAYHRWYRALAAAALRRAPAVAVPSRAALEDLRLSFGFDASATVIANGRAPDRFQPQPKQPVAVAVGRIWDEAKQLHLLGHGDLPLPVVVIGDDRHPDGSMCSLPPVPGLRCTGPLPSAEVAAWMAQSQIYIGTSCYEPFGLAALEAAFSGCALLLNDIPSWREIWGPTALYFRRHDPAALAEQLQRLAADTPRTTALAQAAATHAHQHYTAQRMVARYEELYRNLV